MAKTKSKKNNRARSSQSPRVNTLPRLAILTSILKREGSQKIQLPQRGVTTPTVTTSLVRRNKGLPITIGAEKNAFRHKTKNLSRFQDSLERLTQQQTDDLHKKKICKRRKKRRQTLFKHGIAGKGRRRSPGRNRTYYKNQTSTISC